MKLALTLLFTAFCFHSTAAFACPDLQGTWMCSTDGDPATEAIITQTANGNGMTYSLPNTFGEMQDYVVDGVEHDATDADGNMTTSLLTCDSDSSFSGTQTLMAAGQAYSLTSALNYALTSPTQLEGTTLTTYKEPGQADAQDTDTLSCTRK